MRTQQDCALAVSIYPRFSYDARGGGGTARATPDPDLQRLQVPPPRTPPLVLILDLTGMSQHSWLPDNSNPTQEI